MRQVRVRVELPADTCEQKAVHLACTPQWQSLCDVLTPTSANRTFLRAVPTFCALQLALHLHSECSTKSYPRHGFKSISSPAGDRSCDRCAPAKVYAQPCVAR
jgi:hypothetical protein